MYVMNPDAVIKINKEDTGLHIVQEVYWQLTNEHLQTVYDNFKKSYLRTALYNVIFERIVTQPENRWQKNTNVSHIQHRENFIHSF